jgi:hypothetical protein
VLLLQLEFHDFYLRRRLKIKVKIMLIRIIVVMGKYMVRFSLRMRISPGRRPNPKRPSKRNATPTRAMIPPMVSSILPMFSGANKQITSPF